MEPDALHPGTDPLARVGLEILYARPGPTDDMAAAAPRDLAKELRELPSTPVQGAPRHRLR